MYCSICHASVFELCIDWKAVNVAAVKEISPLSGPVRISALVLISLTGKTDHRYKHSSLPRFLEDTTFI